MHYLSRIQTANPTCTRVYVSHTFRLLRKLHLPVSTDVVMGWAGLRQAKAAGTVTAEAEAQFIDKLPLS